MDNNNINTNITIDSDQINNIRRKYGDGFSNKVYKTTQKYADRRGLIERDARRIVEDAGQVDSGRLIRSITPSVVVYANRIVGEFKSGTQYARFIHEGTRHESDTKLVPHRVKFRVAPTLWAWALRHKKVVKEKGKYYYVGKKDGEVYKYRTSEEKGSMLVQQKALKFFEIPFNKYAPKYIKELEDLLK